MTVETEEGTAWAYATFECQRIDCVAQEHVAIDPSDLRRRTVGELMPEGWAFEYVGNDSVLHCPDHLGA